MPRQNRAESRNAASRRTRARRWIAASLGVLLLAAPPALAAGVATTRDAPKLSTTASARYPKTRFGWYRSAVTLRFHCSAPDQELISGCPAPVTVSRNGTQMITRTVKTTEGHAATIVVRVKIDRIAPRLRASGVVQGRSYRRAPKLRCRAVDTISGIASCKVIKHVVISSDLAERIVHYKLLATNRAGLTASRSGMYRVAGL